MDDFGTYQPSAMADIRESFNKATMLARAVEMYRANVRFYDDGREPI